ncbi:MAG TPA: ABC transporter ATP-binding protein [Porphyromonadaceae bacterium]|nr:ABC transporter ATP-binding protein [Porphyromonadaceae bacterium]
MIYRKIEYDLRKERIYSPQTPLFIPSQGGKEKLHRSKKVDNLIDIASAESGYKEGFHLGPLTMSLKKGDFASLIGPNGSGKSTLFKTIAGDIPLLKGSIKMGNDLLHSMKPSERAKKIAVVTSGEVFPSIRVWDMLLMGRTPHQKGIGIFHSREDKEIAERVMEQTHIEHLKNCNVSTLSAGQQQWVAVATALVQEPELLLLDEATSHLDIRHQIQLMDLLQRMNEDTGLTLLMILHDLNLASEYCNRLFLLQEGKLIVQGAPEDVLRYEIIERVYKTPVVVEGNPISHHPFVLPISAKRAKWKEEK